MTSTTSRAPTLLRRAPSRTRTARQPLSSVAASAIAGMPNEDFESLYAGAVDRLPFEPSFPGHTVSVPFADVALQVEATTANPDAMALVLIDLGENRDLARIELYGNLLWPPVGHNGRPVHNFGLPRSMGVAVRERPFSYADLHGRIQRGTFFSDLRTDWGVRYATQDLRALWGWTPIHLPATYGRFLMLVFADLPRVPGGRGIQRVRFGLDIQRLVIFRYELGVDHHASIEYAPVSARQSRYLGPTQYWTQVGIANPNPVDDQSVTFDAGYDALCLPSALVGLDAVSPQQGAIGVYASAPITTDLTTNDGLTLVLAATTDEIPLISAVRLEFPVDRGKVVGGQGLLAVTDCLVSAWVTNDREAAFSTDPAHPGWRLLAEEQLVESSRTGEAIVEFVEPAWARWVRLVLRPVAPAGSGLAAAPILIRRLDLVRPRHWTIAPEPDEDIALESISIRLRGRNLADDYAVLNGDASAAITVEIRQDAGPYQLVRSFRSLLELIEETHNRMFVNHRAFDKPLQRWRETSTSTTRTKSTSDQTTSGRSTTVVLPEFGNRAATRTGSVTTYTDDPRGNLGQQQHFASLPASVDDELTTTRTFPVDLDELLLPDIDPATMGVDQIVATVVAWAQDLGNQGAPVSLGLGGNVGFNLGAAAGIQVGGSTGFSANAGLQLGGGVTRSTVAGSQSNVTVAESFTTDALTTQEQQSASHLEGTGVVATTDAREVERYDHSAQERVIGTDVQFAGRQEDIIVVSVPINATLRGSPLLTPAEPTRPLTARDSVRVRLDHLPEGIEMDVEFRGQLVPRSPRRLTVYQPRILARGESLLRDPATGLANLAGAADTWHVLAPGPPDERYEISGLAIAIAGDGVLGHLERFGGEGGSLEIGVDVFDGYVGLRDIASLTPVEIRDGFQWRAGTHNGTEAFLEAGARTDGSDRVGLKGLPRVLTGGSIAQAQWESDPIGLRYGASVAGLSWDAALLRDDVAGTIAPPTLEVRTGTTGPGGIAFNPYVTAASTAAQAETGEADFASGLDGDVAQLRITLPYVNVPAATGPSDQVRRTATVFAVCLWIRLATPRWHLTSIAELIDRSEIGRHVGPGGWNGDDVLLLRVPFATSLAGLRGEQMRARYRSGTGSGLSSLEIQAVADLRFDLTKT